ncbi:MAG: hypothetical protein V4559_01980 [Pseudomonadota bacterium]
MRALILAGLVLAALGRAAAAAPGDAIDVTDNDAMIQFRPVVDCAANPGAPHLSIYSIKAHCLADPVITEKDFVRLERLRLGGSPILRALLTPEAQVRYFYATRDHRFQPMALIVQGRPTQVWDVGGAARPVWLIITGGYLTDTRANEVADRYYAQGGRG